MKILVPISQEAESEAAIPRALEMLEGSSSELILAAVGELPEVSEQAAEARSALQQRLWTLASSITRVPVRTCIELAGDPVRGIIEIARDEHVDRIVIASHERGPLESLVDDSVADDLRDELKAIPVTVVPARA